MASVEASNRSDSPPAQCAPISNGCVNAVAALIANQQKNIPRRIFLDPTSRHWSSRQELPGGINCSIGVDSTSATTTTLLSLAFVLLDWGLVVTNALEIRKNPSLRDCSLEATQGRFNALILPYRDLSHKQIQPINEFTRPPLLRNSPTQQKGVRHHLENWRSDQ